MSPETRQVAEQALRAQLGGAIAQVVDVEAMVVQAKALVEEAEERALAAHARVTALQAALQDLLDDEPDEGPEQYVHEDDPTAGEPGVRVWRSSRATGSLDEVMAAELSAAARDAVDE